MDWEKALENVRFLIPLYEEIGLCGLFGLGYLKGLMYRYDDGERSADLYEAMMEAE